MENYINYISNISPNFLRGMLAIYSFYCYILCFSIHLAHRYFSFSKSDSFSSMLLVGMHRLTDSREIMQGFIEMEPNGKVLEFCSSCQSSFFFFSSTQQVSIDFILCTAGNGEDKKEIKNTEPAFCKFTDYIRIQVIFI